MGKKYVLLLFCIIFTVKAYTVSPVHGVWMSAESYKLWQIAGGNIYEQGRGVPQEFTIDGKSYVGFHHTPRIRNDRLLAGDGGWWDIRFFEKSDNRIIYHLSSVERPDSIGTISIILIAEDVIYFESYYGDDNFIAEIRYSSLNFGQEFLYHRVRVSF